MTVNYTTNLALGQPVTGTESGTWGDDVNNAVTSYLDIAIAGTLSLTSASFTANALTLANTQGTSSATNISATTAQYMVLKVSALGSNVTITAPSTSKLYLVDNADATYTVTIKATGQTGYTVAKSTRAWVYYNGTDYVAASTNDLLKMTGAFTSGGVPYFSSATAVASSAALAANALVIGGGAGAAPATTTTGTGVVTAIGNNTNAASGLAVLNASGYLNVAQGGTGQGSYTDGQLLIGNTATTSLSKATLTAGSGVSITNGNGSITIAATGSGGTVTSVSWTGGIVSVANGTTTPAFTIAGTSGGIPYFSSGTTWATSAALAANAIVLGGGAGAAPATTTTGTGVVTAIGNNTNAANGLAVLNASGFLAVGQGGTGQGSYTDGQLLIGNSTGNTLTKATLTAGTGISITNGSGSITIATSGASTSTGGNMYLAANFGAF